jgi:hypothetical protein
LLAEERESNKVLGMKRMVAQLYEAAKPTYDAEEQGEVVGVGQHHGGNIQVYIAHKVAKLREVQAENWKGNQASAIFSGCIMYVNGLTDPPIEELRRLIGINGGECIAYRAVKITHLVCDYFTDAQLKSEHAKVKLNVGNRVHYVMAAWVTESIRQGRRLDENEFAPRGIAKQHGATISSMFQHSAPPAASSSSSMSGGVGNSSRISASSIDASGSRGSSVSADATGTASVGASASLGSCESGSNGSSSSSNRDEVAGLPSIPSISAKVVDLSGEQPVDGAWGSQEALLTSSQHTFIDSLPNDLRGDALEQLRTLRGLKTDRHATREEAVSLENGATEVQHPVNVKDRSGGSDDRAEELSRLVAHLHHHRDGRHCSSKEVRQRAQGYVRQLLAALAGADPGSTAYGTPLPAHSLLHFLLEDYIRWLLRGCYFDQVTEFAVD